MQFAVKKIRKMSSERLLAAIIHKDDYGFPFDYVEICKDELRRRGYTNQDISEEIVAAKSGESAGIIAQEQRRAGRKWRVLWLASALGFALMLIFRFDGLNDLERKVLGACALGSVLLFFLLWANTGRLKATR